MKSPETALRKLEKSPEKVKFKSHFEHPQKDLKSPETALKKSEKSPVKVLKNS